MQCSETGVRLFHAPAPQEPGTVDPAGIPGGTGAAVDLAQGHVCHPETLPQFKMALAAGREVAEDHCHLSSAIP